jgi:hypothetical protein
LEISSRSIIRAAITILALASRVGFAQSDSADLGHSATVRGIVRDSISNSVLQNATVQLFAGTFIRTATTDSAGSFAITGVPIGHYIIGFLHPLLDSIGIDPPLREIDISGPAEVNLATPSPSRMKRAICGKSFSADSGAVIIGTVNDAISGAPSAGVSVTGEWLEYTINRAGISPRLRRLTARTAENGWFALCNVPATGNVALGARKGADSVAGIELQIPANGFARQEIFVAESSGAQKDSSGLQPLQRTIQTGDARLSGRVMSVGVARPIPEAEVAVVGGPSVRTSENGEYLISNAPRGTRMVEIRAVGFYPYRKAVNILPRGAVLNVSLSTLKAVLDTVKVIAKRLPTGPDDGAFARRRRMGIGRFITAADMARFPVINTSDVFKRVPRVRIELEKIQMRGAFETNQGVLGGENWCDASIFLNGRNVSFMTIADIDDWVHPEEVAAIEVYSEGTVPPQFQVGLSGCGSVVIWTK